VAPGTRITAPRRHLCWHRHLSPHAVLRTPRTHARPPVIRAFPVNHCLPILPRTYDRCSLWLADMLGFSPPGVLPRLLTTRLPPVSDVRFPTNIYPWVNRGDMVGTSRRTTRKRLRTAAATRALHLLHPFCSLPLQRWALQPTVTLCLPLTCCDARTSSAHQLAGASPPFRVSFAITSHFVRTAQLPPMPRLYHIPHALPTPHTATHTHSLRLDYGSKQHATLRTLENKRAGCFVASIKRLRCDMPLPSPVTHHSAVSGVPLPSTLVVSFIQLPPIMGTFSGFYHHQVENSTFTGVADWEQMSTSTTAWRLTCARWRC